MQDLGERAVISRTRASRVVDELVAAGYVRRELDPADKRSSFATMTDEGRRAFRRAVPQYLSAIRRHFSDRLSPEELRIMRRALQSVLDLSP